MPIVVVTMSVREAEASERVARMADSVAGTVAHLQLADPSLSRELTRLADAGADQITLVGVSLGSLAPAASWLRRIASHWWRDRVEPRPVVAVATRLVKDEAQLHDALADIEPLRGDEAGLVSAAWEDVPRHRHQLLICRGPRCTALGSDLTAEAFVLALMAKGLGDDDVLITHTGCQFPCNQAPVVSVQPDDVWYGAVDSETARSIVEEHLVAGRPLGSHRLPRHRRG